MNGCGQMLRTKGAEQVDVRMVDVGVAVEALLKMEPPTLAGKDESEAGGGGTKQFPGKLNRLLRKNHEPWCKNLKP